MTATPEGPQTGNDESDLEFARIIAANDLSELDELEAGIETPNLDFIADYEAVIHALSSARHKPNDEQQKKLATAATSSIATFRAYVIDILVQNKDAAPRVITKVLTTANNGRSEFLSEITNNKFDALDDEVATTVEDSLAEKYEASEYDEVIEVAVEIYMSNLQIDITKMLSIAIPEYSAHTSTKLLEAAHKIGRHALDITKIATGVAAGIIIAKQISK